MLSVSEQHHSAVSAGEVSYPTYDLIIFMSAELYFAVSALFDLCPLLSETCFAKGQEPS